MNRPSILNGLTIPYDLKVEELHRQLHPAGSRAWAACLALGYHTDPIAYSILSDLLDSPDWRYRRTALEAICHHPLEKTNIERIIKLLDDQSVYVVRTACEVVGKLGAKQALPILVNLLSSQDPSIRFAAIQTLPYLWETTLFERVLEVFLSDRSDDVRRAAGWVLMGAANETNWKCLFDIWKKDTLGRHRKWACELARQFRSEVVHNDLHVLMKDSDGHVRKAAKTANESIGISTSF